MSAAVIILPLLLVLGIVVWHQTVEKDTGGQHCREGELLIINEYEHYRYCWPQDGITITIGNKTGG